MDDIYINYIQEKSSRYLANAVPVALIHTRHLLVPVCMAFHGDLILVSFHAPVGLIEGVKHWVTHLEGW